jgi:hypothetical protein
MPLDVLRSGAKHDGLVEIDWQGPERSAEVRR